MVRANRDTRLATRAMFCAMVFLQRSSWAWSRAIAGSCIVSIAAGPTAGCVNGPGVLTQLVEARRLASNLRVQFTKAADAANRAVMAETDEASAAAVQESEQATQGVQRDVQQLQPLLQSLGYSVETRYLDAFNTRFAEYRTLDGEILPLAVENTNLKAQRLSFGPGQEAADAFRDALQAAARSVTSKSTCCVEALVANARGKVLEIQVYTGSAHPRIRRSGDVTNGGADRRVGGSRSQGSRRVTGSAPVGGPPTCRGHNRPRPAIIILPSLGPLESVQADVRNALTVLLAQPVLPALPLPSPNPASMAD